MCYGQKNNFIYSFIVMKNTVVGIFVVISMTSGGGSYTMQGNYTTDLISGTMTATVPPYGVIKGEFHLIRAK